MQGRKWLFACLVLVAVIVSTVSAATSRPRARRRPSHQWQSVHRFSQQRGRRGSCLSCFDPHVSLCEGGPSSPSCDGGQLCCDKPGQIVDNPNPSCDKGDSLQGFCFNPDTYMCTGSQDVDSRCDAPAICCSGGQLQSKPQKRTCSDVGSSGPGVCFFDVGLQCTGLVKDGFCDAPAKCCFGTVGKSNASPLPSSPLGPDPAIPL